MPGMFHESFWDQLALVRTVPYLRRWAFTWLEARGLFGERTKDLLYVGVLGREDH